MSIARPPLSPLTSSGGGWLTPPAGAPIPRAPFPPIPGGGALGIMGGITGAIGLIGALGGNKGRDDTLAKMGLAYDPETGLTKPLNPNTGNRDGAPPFTGGQMAGVMYAVGLRYQAHTNGELLFNQYDAILEGPIGGVFKSGITWYIGYGNGLNTSVATEYAQIKKDQPLTITGIRRVDGQPDTGGNPPSTQSPAPSGYTGNNGESPDKPKILPPGLSSGIGWGTGAPVAISPAALGAGTALDPSSLKPSPTGDPLKSPSPSPAISPSPSPIQPSPSPLKKPDEKEKKSPFNPDLPNTPPADLTGIGAMLGLVYGNTNQIKANTSPDALKNAAKAGSCESLQSPQCTKGVEDRIKDPLSGKLDAAKIARDSNAAAQSAALAGITVEQQVQKGVLASILAKAKEIFDLVGGLWNNGIINKAMQYITMITVIHNAAMLSRSIGDTLGSALDSGLQAIGLQIKDKDGSVQSVSQIIGKSFADLIKGVIGAANYTALTETWTQANRIYQTGINLLSNVQSIIDSTTAVAELTSNRVGTLMNSLRNSGIVRENAYGSQSQNVTKFNAFMTKLENLEQGASNLASITSSVVSVQQSVNEFKTNRQEFENALKNKAAGDGTPENAAEATAKSEKRSESVFKINDFTIVRAPEEGN